MASQPQGMIGTAWSSPVFSRGLLESLFEPAFNHEQTSRDIPHKDRLNVIDRGVKITSP